MKYSELGKMTIRDAMLRLYEHFSRTNPYHGDTTEKKAARIRFHLRRAGFTVKNITEVFAS